jgi:hypothetical protein
MEVMGTPNGKGAWSDSAGIFGDMLKGGTEGGSGGTEEMASLGDFHGKDILLTK